MGPCAGVFLVVATAASSVPASGHQDDLVFSFLLHRPTTRQPALQRESDPVEPGPSPSGDRVFGRVFSLPDVVTFEEATEPVSR